MRALFLLAGLTVGSIAASASPAPYTTGYQIDRQQRIELAFEGESSVRLLVDRNTCSVDRFGQRSGCTRMAFHPVEARLVLLEERGDLTLYAIEGTKYRLVVKHFGSLVAHKLLEVEGDDVVDSWQLVPITHD